MADWTKPRDSIIGSDEETAVIDLTERMTLGQRYSRKIRLVNTDSAAQSPGFTSKGRGEATEESNEHEPPVLQGPRCGCAGECKIFDNLFTTGYSVSEWLGQHMQASHRKIVANNLPCRIDRVKKDADGYGVFAKEHIEQGDLILSEWPLFTVPSNWDVRTITAYFELMDPRYNQLFLNLVSRRITREAGAPAEDNIQQIADIFMANALHHHDGGSVYAYISRFNHSCSPNAVHVPESRGHACGDIRALRHIEEGEEITIAYDEWTISRPYLERRGMMYLAHGFWCVCDTCKKCENDLAFREASDNRRSCLCLSRAPMVAIRNEYLLKSLSPVQDCLPSPAALLRIRELDLLDGDKIQRAWEYFDWVCEEEGLACCIDRLWWLNIAVAFCFANHDLSGALKFSQLQVLEFGVRFGLDSIPMNFLEKECQLLARMWLKKNKHAAGELSLNDDGELVKTVEVTRGTTITVTFDDPELQGLL